jgi:2-dehydropantoate 2-reductase
MRIAIVGAGAIGGLLGVRLIQAGHTVTLIDIGRHLQAIREHGLGLIGTDGREILVHPHLATASMAEAGPQDLVILAVKSYTLPQIAPQLHQMVGAGTAVISVQNGIPWWYFQKHGGVHEGRRIESIDPAGIITRHLDPERIIGCVVYPAAEISRPGVIRHIEGNRLPLGELDGSETPRVTGLAGLLNEAGFKSFVLTDIRGEIWLKLLGNLSFNHICALTRATMVDVCRFEPTRELARRMMEEAETIANRLGVTLRLPIAKRIEGAEKVGAHRPSTLQDVLAGLPLELGPVITAVAELGRITGVETPYTDAIHALVALLDRTVRQADEVSVIQPREGLETPAADKLRAATH